jgi:peptidoglycan/LPS O-acetylase OafA/YrhL
MTAHTATVDAALSPIAVENQRAETPATGLERGRSSGLDGLRVVACLLVVAFHLRTVNGLSFGPLDPIIRGGDTGIYVFFALSGYLLYKPFVRGPVDLVGYGLKRAGRILPGYFVALVALTVLTGNRLPLEHPLPFLTMTASYDVPLRGFLGNAWTLSAEILFYVTLPLIAQLARGRETLVIGGLGVASALLGVVQRFTVTPESAWLIGTYPFVFNAFVPGMLLAALEVRHPNRFRQLRTWPFLATGIGFVVFGALTSLLPVAFATGIGTALLMAFLIQHRLPFDRALGFAGGASYSLYLWHKDALIAFGPVVGIAIALLASGLSWALVERSILRRVHALAAEHRREHPASQAVAVPVP